jgi:hypothetical protein
LTAFEREDVTQPGFDLHEWKSGWASIEEDSEDHPDAALSQLADLVERMLVASGYELSDPVLRSGGESEPVVAYRAARETAERAELGEASRGEVEVANANLRDVFSMLARDADEEI